MIVNESMLPRWTREILEEIGAASPGLKAESSAAVTAEIRLQVEASNRMEFKFLVSNMKSDVTQKNGVVTEGLRLSNKKKPKGTKKVLTRLRSLVFQDGQQLTKSPGVQVLQKPEAEFQISLGKYSFVTFPTF